MRKLLCKIAPPAGITAGIAKSPRHGYPRETTMFAKTIFVAVRVLAGTSLTFVGNATDASGHPAGRLCPPGHSYQECFYGG